MRSGKTDYWKTFQGYLRSHRFRQIPPEGQSSGPDIKRSNEGAPRMERMETRQPWIDENLNP